MATAPGSGPVRKDLVMMTLPEGTHIVETHARKASEAHMQSLFSCLRSHTHAEHVEQARCSFYSIAATVPTLVLSGPHYNAPATAWAARSQRQAGLKAGWVRSNEGDGKSNHRSRTLAPRASRTCT